MDTLKRSLGISPEQKVLLTVGRVAKEKNLAELLDYFGRLSLPDAVLCIVGGGTYLETLRQLAAEKGIADRVIFTDAVSPDKIPLYYQIGDIFLSASQSETQGLTYLEALASGLPLVCRKDACLDGIVTDGWNGGLYTSFEPFQKWITAFCGDAAVTQQLSRHAVQTAERFSAAGFAEKVEFCYQEVLKNWKMQSA
ncbi:glycosyltransferase [uncultured Ruminococcus sp.]|uniref:glycosyltransferase n=1 Tax=Ruminococcus sp. TaxID=41978 RepID=UPI00260ED7DF|nr:glycosyltransferase [uncultured Ruminococcus sp.]